MSIGRGITIVIYGRDAILIEWTISSGKSQMPNSRSGLRMPLTDTGCNGWARVLRSIPAQTASLNKISVSKSLLRFCIRDAMFTNASQQCRLQPEPDSRQNNRKKEKLPVKNVCPKKTGDRQVVNDCHHGQHKNHDCRLEFVQCRLDCLSSVCMSPRPLQFAGIPPMKASDPSQR